MGQKNEYKQFFLSTSKRVKSYVVHIKIQQNPVNSDKNKDNVKYDDSIRNIGRHIKWLQLQTCRL